MCVAELNVSTQPCNHRWYELVRSCEEHTHLANCPEKLRLQGWEIRNASCPWCDSAVPETSIRTHRLFGSTSSASSTASTPTSPIPWTRPRSGSGGTLSSTRSTLSRHSSITSMESERGQRHRDMNERLSLYLSMSPHEVLPSAKKNYPTYTDVATREESPASDVASTKTSSGLLGKHWRKSVRFSKGVFKT